MIKELTISAFRKVDQSTMIFTEGLNVIRGANESSKSTRLEAISYCLFGSKALANTIDEVVTWGRPVKDLRVELTLELEDTFRFVRAKSGAEVYKNGGSEPFVTGQAECTAFAAQLLGADLNAALNLMVATQGNLRAVLEGGPKAASEIIESLADLDVIEQIIDKAQQKWQLGSTAVLADRLTQAQATLTSTVVGEAPDEAAHKAALASAQAQLAALNENIKSVSIEHDGVLQTLNDESARQTKAANLTAQITDLTARLSTTEREADEASQAAAKPVDDPAPFEAIVRDGEAAAAARAAWEKFQEVPLITEHKIRAEHTEELRKAGDTAKNLQSRYNTAQTQIKILKSQRITSDTCPSCGQDISKLPHIAAKKQEIEAGIAAQEAIIRQLELDDEVNDRWLADLKIDMDGDAAVKNAIRGIEKYVKVIDSAIPAIVKWDGPSITDEVVDVAAAKKRLEQIKAAIKARDMAQGRLETLNAQAKKLTSELAQKIEERNELAPASKEDFEKLNAAYIDVSARIGQLRTAAENLEASIGDLRLTFQREMDAYQSAMDKREVAQAAVTQLMNDIKEIEANNILLKKVRAARPIIAAKLWGLVLNTVSNMFSRMRGELSVVTREKDGFYVNGKPAFGGGLSGSAKDILGLSIRAALVKTFLPNCPFLIVDEPAQGCDEDRSAALTGFIASVGFNQSIMVTHSSLTEAGAVNLIQL